LDIGVLFLENGNLQMMIDYYSDSYGVPVRDTLQNWAVNRKNTRRVGDMVELHFSRGLNTADISRVGDSTKTPHK
jgi:hypothetical protein